MRPEFRLRIGTQDPGTFKEVLLQNCYNLPERFDAEDRIVDVGANIGCFAVACLVRGCGPMMLVEPHPDNVVLARQNTSAWLAQVAVIQGAVYWRSKEWVSIVDRGPHTAMHYVGRADDERLGCSVRRIALDDLINERGVRLLKLDCEGGEYPALFEARRLKLVREIVVECHPTEFPGRGRLDGGDVRRFLEGAGFEVTAVGVEQAADKRATGNEIVFARNRAL